MKSKLIELFVVTPLYAVFCVLRLVFLSCRAGAVAHNFVYYWLFRIVTPDPQHSHMVARLRETLSGYSNIVEWQRRIYTSHQNTVRHALKNVFARRFLIGSFRRYRLEKQGHVVPYMIMLSLNTPEAGCNLACNGCYAVGHTNTTLPPETVHKIVQEQEALGIYHVMLLGGEPLLYKGIMDIAAGYPDTSFYIATNGTMLTQELVARMTHLGNVCPMISLEGLEVNTDSVRGKGVFKQVLSAMKICAQARLPYTVTATVTKQNLEEVTSREFLQLLDSHRCCGISYSCYVAIGRDPHPERQLSVTESEQLDNVRDLVFRNFSMFASVGRNGISRVTNCFAAHQYFHVLPDGQVESCPFAQWADPSLNITRHSILEITASPLFAGIREIQSYGIKGITPCQAPHLSSLRNAFIQLGAKPTVNQPVIHLERIQT